MRPTRVFVLAAAAVFSVLPVSPALADSSNAGATPDQADQGLSYRPVCPEVSGAEATCRALVVTGRDGAAPRATKTYQKGYNPAQLGSAYGLGAPATGTWNPAANPGTVAIVDAFDNPSAASDLAVYRKQFNLPVCADGGVTSCGLFTKVNQNGVEGSYPRGDTGWGQEIALDLDMASAVCPQCAILLVEGTSNSLTNLGIAVNTAASMGAVAISNSYGTSSDGSAYAPYAGYYDHPGIAVTASSGDSGYGISFPDDLPTVVAVGGTHLDTDSSTRGWTETVWSGAGSGCSSYFTQPSWQTPLVSAVCSHRVSSDISAVADPYTGVAVYDSYGSRRGNNWYVFGGTSVSSPIIASVFALAGNANSTDYPARLLYIAGSSTFNDVVSGSNGSCGGSLLCTAKVGYDGPTGLGTPNGTSGF